MINGYAINVRPDRCIIARDGKYVLIGGVIHRDNESMRIIIFCIAVPVCQIDARSTTEYRTNKIDSLPEGTRMSKGDIRFNHSFFNGYIYRECKLNIGCVITFLWVEISRLDVFKRQV